MLKTNVVEVRGEKSGREKKGGETLQNRASNRFWGRRISKMQRCLVLIMVLIAVALPHFARQCYSGEIDILLEKLVEKGLITDGEARQIKTETQEQIRREIAEGKSPTLPQWVQMTKLKGDLRTRFQRDHTKKTATVTKPNRDRARIRLRLGLDSRVNNRLVVAMGVATGLADGSADASRSTNVTLENSSSKKLIALDYASANLSLTSSLDLLAGKFKNPLWEPGDLIWDTDINPEGAVLKFLQAPSSKTEIFVTSGVLVLDEIKDASDPLMYAFQSGVTQALTGTLKLRAAFSYYGFGSVKGKKLDGTAGTNSKDSDGKLIYGYANMIPAFEVTKQSVPFPLVGIPYLALFGEYVKNTDSDVKEENSGYMIGFKAGAEKIQRWKDWQVRYNYAKYEKDAFLDILPDSDRYGGKTGVRAHEAMLDLGLAKNTWLGLDFYYGEELTDQPDKKPKTLLQVDWNMKF